MFTGIIRQVSQVSSISPREGGARLAIDLGKLAGSVSRGDSVAVSGVCLTVTEKSGTVCEFDAVAETMSRTTLGALKAGARVNIEPSLRAGDQIGGHFVMGHVDAVGTVASMPTGPNPVIRIQANRETAAQLVEKGSVALDGVSLTVVDVSETAFTCALIPTTLADTTLGSKKAGDSINVETDVFGKYIQKYLGKKTGAITIEKLRETGFA